MAGVGCVGALAHPVGPVRPAGHRHTRGRAPAGEARGQGDPPASGASDAGHGRAGPGGLRGPDGHPSHQAERLGARLARTARRRPSARGLADSPRTLRHRVLHGHHGKLAPPLKISEIHFLIPKLDVQFAQM